MGRWVELYPPFSNFPPSIWAVSVLNLEGLQISWVCQNSFDKLLIQSNNSIRYSFFLISDGLRLFSVGTAYSTFKLPEDREFSFQLCGRLAC